MNHQNAFLKALAENEDDTTTRLVYADWLEEQGEHEEADRQRKWPAAKDWLVRLCEKHNPDDVEQEVMAGNIDGFAGYGVIAYKELLKLGQEAIENPDQAGEFGFDCGANMEIMDALNANCLDFWKNWSIVTGIALPADVEKKSYFRCAC